MSLKVDRLQLEIVINSDPARQKLRELNDESLKIQKGMKGMKEGSAEYLAESAKLKAVKTQMDGVYQSIGLTGLSLNELKKKQQEFNMAVRNLPANSPEYARYKKDLDDINGRITELTGKGKAAQGIMQTIFGVAGGVGLYEAAAAGIKKVASSVKDFFEEGIKAAIELRDAERVMLLELDGQRDVQKDLISLAKEKAKTTMFSRLELEVAEKFLINQERSPALIKKTIEAATNLATVTGVSLQNAVEDLDATMSGTMPKSLKRLEQGFRDLSKEQMYNGAAVDLINKKYSGEAQNEMDSYTGQLNIMEKAFRALRRTVGEWIIGSGGMFSAAIEGATALLNTFQKWFEIPISKKLEDEQSRVNFLAASLSDANISAENRNKLYRELETLAPGVVEGLDKENISYQKLTSNLAAYNDQMVNKIIIEKENEKVENVNEKLAKAKMETYNQEIYMREDILKTVTRLKKEAKGQDETNAAASIAHANKLTATLYDTQLTFSQKMKKLKEEHLVNIGAMNVYEINQEEQIKAQAAVNLQLQAKNTLIKELGINVQTVTAKNSETIKKEGTVISNYTKMTIDELNKLINAAAVMGATEKEKFESRQASAELKRREDSLKHQKSYTDDYAKIIQDAENIEKMNFAERLNRSQQDIKNVNEKYNNEIQKLREFKKAKEESGDLKPDQALGIDTEIYKLEITRKQQVNQVLLQAEKEFADEVKKVHENMRVARMAVTQRQLYEVKKKYSDMRKEIWDAIVYNYDQEVKAAEGNEDKIAAAKKKKGQEYAKIKHSMFLLKNAQQEEEDKITAQNEEKFVDELNNLKLKADKDLAVGT
jgi:hypothetical protein